VVPSELNLMAAKIAGFLKELDLPTMLRTPEPGKFYNSVDSAEEK
jgi:hypothetical protein